ncbi:3-hydroxyisobutyrate dehydrogenase [Bacterioplanes sanyensis]|uniref:NAD(P)-dependent oxidoreductase n=1 Tax=Bacterioplanes sanyensis TaxID=1249553 RepID=UPI001674C665|nr:NAD(P)-dependent oxidoreductase [Bacterioplanes sanyensis]GGY53936.1 3-hydroxyisobutyrate dehydrogenase [Bacterioplanes sanyensis]
MAKLCFIGLGTMGYPMAGHLANAGHTVRVWNRTHSKALQWADNHSGQACESIAEAAKDADAVLLCVGRDSDVRELISAEGGIATHLKPGTLIIDHTTTSSSLAQEMHSYCQTHQLIFADAPVSGGEQGAIQGQLSLMVGCDEKHFDTLKSLTAPYTKAIERLGNAGAGQATKMVNQICIAGLVQGLAEGLLMAQAQNLDIAKVVSVISQGAAGSWQMENRHQTMSQGEYNHGFAVDWMRKDLGICLDEARQSGISLPVTALVDQFYAELQALGQGRSDTSALLYRLQQLNPSS